MINRCIIQDEDNSQILFSVFINNLMKYIKKCNTVLFADDVQIDIDCDIDKIGKCIKTNNDDIGNIETFCAKYGFDINPEKTKATVVSSKNNLHKLNLNLLLKICVNGNKIEFVDNIRDLGFQINRINTNDHQTKIHTTKSFWGIEFNTSIKKKLSSEIKLKLYNSIVLPK